MGLYDAMDDETFLATVKLNAPQAIDAAKAGALRCDCDDCNRLKRLMAEPDPAEQWSPGLRLQPALAQAQARAEDRLIAAIFGVDPAAASGDATVTVNGEGDSLTVDKVRGLQSEAALLDTIFGGGTERRIVINGAPGAFEGFLRDTVEQSDDEDLAKAERAYRKERPIGSGVIAYFPDALAEVAHVSFVGNEQHNPGEPLHWAREKSTDEADALSRHLADFLSGEEFDTDGTPHVAKVAWRALALLQRWYDGEYADGYHS